MPLPRLGVAVVTMGNRPHEVNALLASVAAQDVPPARVVIVGNGSPLPGFFPLYLGTWALLTLARTHTLGGLRAWAAGFAEGLRTPCGERRPMRWRTVGRMTRLGRPPLI